MVYNFFYIKLLFACAIFVVTLWFGFIPSKFLESGKRHLLSLCHSFAGGVFLGAAFLHLLPEANSGSVSKYPIVGLIVIATFLVMLFIERSLPILTKKYKFKKSHIVSCTLVALLSIHSLIEGAAIGIGSNLTVVMMIFVAVIAHKGSESLALASNLHLNEIRDTTIKRTLIIFSFVTPFGILLLSFISKVTFGFEYFFNAIAAGTFIYLGSEHAIDTPAGSHSCIFELLFLSLGVLVMALAALVRF